MNTPDMDLIAIEAYLQNKMSSQERDEFEQRLSNSPELQQLLADYKDTTIHLKTHFFQQNLKANFQQIEKEAIDSKRKVTYLSAIAASLLLIIVACYQFFLTPASPSALFANYFEPYPYLGITRSNKDSTIKNQIDAVFNTYNQGSYKEALVMLNQLNEIPEEEIHHIQFYAAMLFLTNNQPVEAIAKLQSIQQGSSYLPQKNWYLALAYLDNDQPDLAKQELQKIKEGKFKFKEAQNLLKKL